MHSYLHNIKTFNNATRHLTRVERSLYRDLIELYYDTQQPLPAVDFDRLCRLVLAHTDEEKAAARSVLGEFFTLTGEVYTHDYCDEQIEAFNKKTSAKSIAGIASAKAKKERSAKRKQQRSTGVEQVLNSGSTLVLNHEQETINHKPNITSFQEVIPKAKKATRLPPYWQVSKKLTEWAMAEKGMTQDQVLLEAERFRDYWVAMPDGKQATKSDWDATWRNWIRRSKQIISTSGFIEKHTDNDWSEGL